MSESAVSIPRAHLLASVWGKAYHGRSRTVDVHVHRLRRKLGPEYGPRLVTMRNLGYMYRPPATDVLPADEPLAWSRPSLPSLADECPGWEWYEES